MSANDWLPEGIPLDKPSPGRIYDYFLGGYHNFESDRAVADKVLEVFPEARGMALSHRAFLRRAVRLFVEQGIEQFLDIGSGIPTSGHIHHVAQAANLAARVVYVDIDPVVIAHGKALLRDNPGATIVQADMRRPEELLANSAINDMLDFDEPVALIFGAVLHYVLDDDAAYEAVRILTDALAPGSYVIISQISLEAASKEVIERAIKVYGPAGTAKARTWEEIRRFFGDLQILEPGLVRAPLWRPELSDGAFPERPEGYVGFVGVGYKT